VWEAVRETIQNGLDEQEEKGHELIVTHKGTTLKVRNIGADLQAKALLMGHTTKDGLDLRGQHGEGLNLGMLAAVRAHRKMTIETQREVWTPSISYSTEYGERVLQVRARVRRQEGDGVEVSMEVTSQEWEEYKKNFLPLNDLPEEDCVRTETGTILFDPSYKGRVYVKGIFVSVDTDLKYGYDLKNAKLDRDRRLLDSYDRRWQIGRMFSEAVASSPQKIGKVVFDLLQNEWEDVKGLGTYNTSAALRASVAEHFEKEFGEDAIPVQSIGDSAEIEHFGKKGIVANTNLREVLFTSKIQSPAQIKNTFSKAVKKSYSFHELEDFERSMLNLLEESFSKARNFIPNSPVEIEDFAEAIGVSAHTLVGFPSRVLDSIEIVDYFDPKVKGLCDLVTGSISLSKSSLTSLSLVLRVYVHELSHKITGSSDGYKDHVDTLQDLWVILYNLKISR
jgi:hypothetical protein